MKQVKKVLSVVLALAMVMAMSVMAFAAEETNKVTPKAGKVDASLNADGTKLTVKVYASGEDMALFDYGIAFNGNKMSIDATGIEVNPEIENAKFTDGEFKGKKWYPALDYTTGNNYAAVAGTSNAKQLIAKDTLIVTFTLDVKDSNITDKDLAVTTDTMKYVPESDAKNFPSNEDGTPDLSAKATQDGLNAPQALTVVKESPASEAPSTVPSEAASTVPSTAASTVPSTAASTAPSTAASTAPSTAASTPAKTATPKTADTASVAIPVVAIVAAAAAVVAVSKKKVEE